MTPPDTPNGLAVCNTCGFLIYPRDSVPHAEGRGCTCKRPRPQPGLIARPPDADQLALFPRTDSRPRKMRAV